MHLNKQKWQQSFVFEIRNGNIASAFPATWRIKKKKQRVTSAHCRMWESGPGRKKNGRASMTAESNKKKARRYEVVGRRHFLLKDRGELKKNKR